VSPNTPLPAGAMGAVPAAVQGPQLPPKDRIIKVTAYARADGWVTVTVYYQVCPFGEEEEDLDVWERRCIQVRRYYIPAQRAPKRLKPKTYRAWYSDRYIEMWLNALTEYVEDVVKILELAADNAPEEAGEALKRFEVRAIVAPPDGLITELGIKVGHRVIPLGPPPDPIYTFMAKVDPPGTLWHDVAEREFVRAIAWTRYWKEAVERVAGCRVEYRISGAADVVCNGKAITIPAVMPIFEAT